ncbi:MAG TPA: hypothetical protein ENN87_17325 [Phycisphaerales bacterium]|nr:hypothetical protein [Phycisphaerales bacterium]
MRLYVIAFIGALMLVIPATRGQESEVDEPQLCVGDYQTERQAAEQLQRFAATWHTLDQWKARAANIRRVHPPRRGPGPNATQNPAESDHP